MLLARLATILAPSTYYVPHMVNAMNCPGQRFCILFLFWTITHLARRILTRQGAELTKANIVAVLGTGAVGALAYTFTDTFWFSAVEGEVYAPLVDVHRSGGVAHAQMGGTGRPAPTRCAGSC